MHTKLGIAALALSLGAGCVNPRSVVLGQTPRMMSTGEVEVGIATGVAWDSFSDGQGSSASATVQLPAAEANIAYGLSDGLDLNLHASTAGLQPGVKIKLPSAGMLEMALMPSLAGGLYAGRTYSTVNGNNSSTPINAWTVLGGVKFLAAIPAGLYGGVGYDFQYFRYRFDQDGGGTVDTGSGLTSHHVNINLGWELKVGMMRVRPEFAFSFSPFVYQHQPEGSTNSPEPMNELMVMPNVTIAFAAPTGGGN